MLLRFVSAVSVAAVLVAPAAILFLFADVPVEARYLMTTIWCIVPAAWGIWAMITPAAWFPQRLPLWGALLGLLGGLMITVVLGVPDRLLEGGAWAGLNATIVVVAVVLYAGFWAVVRRVHGALTKVG